MEEVKLMQGRAAYWRHSMSQGLVEVAFPQRTKVAKIE